MYSDVIRLQVHCVYSLINVFIYEKKSFIFSFLKTDCPFVELIDHHFVDLIKRESNMIYDNLLIVYRYKSQ